MIIMMLLYVCGNLNYLGVHGCCAVVVVRVDTEDIFALQAIALGGVGIDVYG